MLRNSLLIVLLIVTSTLCVQGQEKKPLDFSVYDGWNYVEDKGISNNGDWVFYEVNPYKGDGQLTLWSSDDNEKQVFPRGTGAILAPSSEFVAFTIKPYHDTVRQMKLEEVPDKKLDRKSVV